MYTYATKQMYTFYKTQANKTLWLYTFKTRRANTITGLIGVTNHFRHLKRKQHTCQRNRPPHKEELLEICKPPQPIKDSTIDIYVSVHLFIGIRQESQEKIKFKCSRCICSSFTGDYHSFARYSAVLLVQMKHIINQELHLY